MPRPPTRPSWARRSVSWRAIGAALGRIDGTFPAAERRLADPVRIPHRYSTPRDIEVAALVASSLAFGRVAALVRKAEQAVLPFGPHLADAVAGLAPGEVPRHLEAWVHRWIGGRDLAYLLGSAGALIRRHGSLGEAFRSGLSAEPATDLLVPMQRFALALRADPSPFFGSQPMPLGARTLVPVPDGKAASKRLCLFLRWMVRDSDGVDFGLWSFAKARHLTIPLDTHVARIARYIGLTNRLSPGWPMAREITRNLARFDADDPTRHDFALAHLGIMGGCPARRDLRKCAACDLAKACRL